jgi:glutamate-1-semialdehyde 2,1-aminomutase
MGLVPPVRGFLEGLRAACDAAGALLIFDEVITGFRLAAGGASTRLGVQPDLWCFGKVLGGGLPLAAFAGGAALMDELAPLGPVYQAGTLSGNPLATAAGLAALALLDDDAYEHLDGVAARLAAALRAATNGAGIDVVHCATLVGFFFSPTPVRDVEGARASAATGRYRALFHGVLERGVALAPGPYEIMFPGLAHTDTEIDQTAGAFAQALGDSRH